MKWLTNTEKKFFPYDSPFQRIRRRRAILLGLILVPVILVGVAKFIVKFTSLTGRIPVRAEDMKLKRGTRQK